MTTDISPAKNKKIDKPIPLPKAVQNKLSQGFINGSKGGRPSKLTKELATRICIGVRNGLHPREASIRSGIDEKTYYNWLERAKNGQDLYVWLFKLIKESEIVWEYDLVDKMTANALKSDNVIQQIIPLSRRHPDRYSEKYIAEENTQKMISDNLEKLGAILAVARGDVVEGEFTELPDTTALVAPATD